MAEKPTYAIKDWNRFFENAGSRKVSKLAWVAMPNSHDTGGYARVMAHERGAEIYAAWCLMVQTASKTTNRGILANDRGPFDANDLAVRTQLRKPELFQLAIDFLSSPEIGWLELVARYQHATSTLPVRPDEVAQCASALGGGSKVIPTPYHTIPSQTGPYPEVKDHTIPNGLRVSRGLENGLAPIGFEAKFAVTIGKAFGLSAVQMEDSRFCFEQIAERIVGLPGWNAAATEAVACAQSKEKAKRSGKLRNPVGAWRKEMDRRFPE